MAEDLRELAYMPWCPFGPWLEPHEQYCVCGGKTREVTYKEWLENQSEGHALRAQQLHQAGETIKELSEKLSHEINKASELAVAVVQFAKERHTARQLLRRMRDMLDDGYTFPVAAALIKDIDAYFTASDPNRAVPEERLTPPAG